MKKTLLPMLGLLAIAATSSGCRLAQPAPPTAYQQQRAQRFDPYPENDSMQPMEGSRPREFDRPLSEPERARWGKW